MLHWVMTMGIVRDRNNSRKEHVCVPHLCRTLEGVRVHIPISALRTSGWYSNSNSNSNSHTTPHIRMPRGRNTRLRIRL